MALVHDLRGNILSEAVDDAVHEGVFAEQRNMARFAGKHGKFLCKIRRHIEILRLLYGGFLRDLQAVDTVYPELCDLLPVVVEANEVVNVVVPEQGIRGNEVDLSVVPMDALLGGRVIEVAEGDLFPFRYGGLDAVYADVDALVDSFYAAVDVYRCRFSSTASPGATKAVRRLTSSLLFPGVMNRADCTASISSLTSGASK